MQTTIMITDGSGTTREFTSAQPHTDPAQSAGPAVDTGPGPDSGPTRPAHNGHAAGTTAGGSVSDGGPAPAWLLEMAPSGPSGPGPSTPDTVPPAIDAGTAPGG